MMAFSPPLDFPEAEFDGAQVCTLWRPFDDVDVMLQLPCDLSQDHAETCPMVRVVLKALVCEDVFGEHL